MLFSIIIPVYNTEQYLSQCVESVLAQRFGDYEVLLVDDGSKDKSPMLCDEYASHDKRIKAIHKVNGGLSSARNTGLDKAEGDYIVFLDSDDWWDDENMLTNIARSIDKAAPDVVCFRMKKYLQNVNIMLSPNEHADMDDSQKADIKSMIKRGLFGASACNKVIKRDFVERYNIRFVQGQLSEDIEWCLLMLCNGSDFLYIDKPYYVYRKQNGESISSNVGRKNLEDIAGVIKKYTSLTAKNIIKYQSALNFLAEQYVLWIANSTLVEKDGIKDLLQEMKGFWYLLDYDWHPNVQKVRKIRFLGFGTIRKFLGLYLKYKR